MMIFYFGVNYAYVLGVVSTSTSILACLFFKRVTFSHKHDIYIEKINKLKKINKQRKKQKLSSN